VHVDVAVLRYVHTHGEPFLTLSASVLEAVFSPESLLSAAALAGCALAGVAYRRKEFRLGFSGVVLLAIAFGTGALAEFFKVLFHRARPPVSLQLVHETGNGFPSAHAVAIVAVGAAVWYLWSIRPEGSRGGSWRAKARVGLAVVALALLVGIGRIYEGAHYPSDVLAGWALGGVWASVCLTAAEVFRRLYGNGSMGFSGGRATPPTGQPSERRQDADPPSAGGGRERSNTDLADRGATPYWAGAKHPPHPFTNLFTRPRRRLIPRSWTSALRRSKKFALKIMPHDAPDVRANARSGTGLPRIP